MSQHMNRLTGVSKRVLGFAAAWLRWIAVVPALLVLSVALSSDSGGWRWDNPNTIFEDERELCGRVFAHMKTVAPSCWVDAVESFSGFSDPPWQDLDPATHIDLLAKILRYRQEGSSAYFSKSAKDADSRYKNLARSFVASKGEMKDWRVRLLSYFDYPRRVPTGPEPQTIVGTISRTAYNSSGDCPGESSHNVLRGTYLVTADLQDLDARVDRLVSAALSDRWPVLYLGVPLLIGRYDVWRFAKNGLRSACDYSFDEAAQRKN